MSCRAFVSVAALVVAAFLPARLAAQPLPTTSGRVLEASDGDLVVVPHDARVTIVTRAQVQARLIYLPARRTLLLLTDPAVRYGDGRPDAKGFYRWELQQPWPLEARWEGAATLDEYVPSHRGPSTLAIHTDRGTVVMRPPEAPRLTLSPAPVAVLQAMRSSSRATRGTFDEIEQAWLTGGEAALSGAPGPIAGVRMRPVGPLPSTAAPEGPAPPADAVRVGGNVRMPRRVQSADPVYPEIAQRAGVQGVVILELHVGTDGAVSNARVLRSIPLLDQAAIDAVRQWRYEPTLLNGAAVPVILTATVNFTPTPAR